MSGFNININTDFAAGIATGWATAYALYRARHLISAARSSVSQQASSAQEYATRNADRRYIGDLIKFCEANHLAGDAVPLSNLLVEPRFIPAPELAAPLEDDVVRSVFHIVPIVPDHPYLHAPYNVETLSIEELGNGNRTIALLGQAGSGRTTALQAIALWSLGKVRFDPPRDNVLEQMEEEDAKLKSDERNQRIKERQQSQAMAMRLARKRSGENAGIDDDRPYVPIFRQMTPVYAHLANVTLHTGEFGRNVDPAEPLVRAVQHYVGRVTGKTLPRNLYERLNEGKVLLLLDGLDDLPAEEQRQKLAWLEALAETYSHNFIIVSGPASGYGGLMSAGYMPVFLRPWHDIHTNQIAETWADSWSQIIGGRRRGSARPDEQIVASAKTDNRARSPFELTLKMWSTYTNPDQTEFEGWIRTVLAHYLPNEPMGTILPRLIQTAKLQLDEGYITASTLEQALLGLPISPDEMEIEEVVAEPTVEAGSEYSEYDEITSEEVSEFLDELDDEDEDVDSLFEREEAPALETPVQSNGKTGSPKPPQKEKAGKEHVKLLDKLYKRGLLVRWRGGRYQFRHPLIAAYLGSLALHEMSYEERLEKADMPGWQYALAYTAMHTPLDNVVEARMDAPADVLQNALLAAARWLAYADAKAEWRPLLLKRLGNMFVAPSQYALVRERVAAALIDTRDKNTLVIFRRALKHPNADVRRLACLGVGALGADEAIEDIVPLLSDADGDVVLAAGLALGAIGTDLALEEMVLALTTGSEGLRQAVAEAFAAIPEEGYPLLYDAIQHEDMMLRRAAVFGLKRINTPWALAALYKSSLEDKQWYVSSAAQIAFQEMQTGKRASGVQAYPDVGDIAWLREWVIELGGEAAQENLTPDEYLLRAYEDGEPELQMISVSNIGQLGLVSHVGILYDALRHQRGDVREAAHRALGDIQLKMGQSLPSPV